MLLWKIILHAMLLDQLIPLYFILLETGLVLRRVIRLASKEY